MIYFVGMIYILYSCINVILGEKLFSAIRNFDKRRVFRKKIVKFLKCRCIFAHTHRVSKRFNYFEKLKLFVK